GATRQSCENKSAEAGKRIRKRKGTSPNSGHCSETVGKKKLIHGKAIAAVARLDGIQTKFVRAVRVAGDEFSFISDGEGTLKRSRSVRMKTRAPSASMCFRE